MDESRGPRPKDSGDGQCIEESERWFERLGKAAAKLCRSAAENPTTLLALSHARMQFVCNAIVVVRVRTLSSSSFVHLPGQYRHHSFQFAAAAPLGLPSLRHGGAWKRESGLKSPDAPPRRQDRCRYCIVSRCVSSLSACVCVM